MVAQPHFLLFCDTHHNDHQRGDARQGAYAGVGSGRWHFVLEQLDGPERLEAADSESVVNRERLALLSVVRGLEALEQPSHVTLVTTSRYVSRGLRYGLNTWREADYMWERFGEQRPVRNSDLWRRVDTALQFHGIKCRLIQSSQTAPAAETAWQPGAGLPTPHKVELGAVATPSPGLTQPSLLPAIEIPVHSALETFANVQSPAAIPPSVTRDLQIPRTMWQPARTSWLGGALATDWWSLAAAWIRWWRGRTQVKTAFYGT